MSRPLGLYRFQALLLPARMVIHLRVCHIRPFLSPENRKRSFRSHGDQLGDCLLRLRRHVRREHNIGHRHKGVICREGLLNQDVQSRAGDLAVLQCGNQAGSFTTSPRAAFRKKAVGFIALNCSAAIMPRVEGMDGICKDTKSAAASASSIFSK
mgnify:CR=1 FL=1